MKYSFKICVFCALAFGLFSPLTIIAAPLTANSNSEGSVVRKFQNDDIGQVLRVLARQANINLVVSDKVTGTVTMRLRNITPLKAIQVVCTSKNLILDKIDGVYYVKTQEERNQQLNDLDNPEVPTALAEFRKRYYDALIKRGFTKEQAFQLVKLQPVSLHDIGKSLWSSGNPPPEKNVQELDVTDLLQLFWWLCTPNKAGKSPVSVSGS